MSDAVLDQGGSMRSARVEAVRALAATAVLTGHAWGWSQSYGPSTYDGFARRLLLSGGFAVFLFFALTGYLLFLPFARACWADGPPVRWGRYARHRALRVLPLYYVVVGVYLLWQGSGLRDQWWRFALLLEGFSDDTVVRVVPPVWSLLVEVQFYVLLPLLAAALSRVARSSLGRASAVVGLMTVGLALLRITTVNLAAPSAVWRYSLPATAVFFGPGMLLALLQVRLERGPAAWTRSWAATPLVWLIGATGLFLAVVQQFRWDALLLPASFLALGAVVLPLRSQTGLGWLDWRPLGALGLASYSLYLWHEPLVRLLAQRDGFPAGFPLLWLTSSAVSVLVALLSYRWVEVPFLRLRGGRTRPQQPAVRVRP